MKEIKAIIRPNKLSTLRSRLMEIPEFPGMTVVKAEGCSGNIRHVSSGNKIKDELTDFTPKVFITIIAADEIAHSLVERIIAVAQSGQIGDGLVWVTDVEKASFIYKSTGSI
jgi:nitrogen regulatory protein P-II 1